MQADRIVAHNFHFITHKLGKWERRDDDNEKEAYITKQQ